MTGTPGPGLRGIRPGRVGEQIPHLAAVSAAVQAAAAVAVLHPGAPVRDGHALRPAGPPKHGHCGRERWGECQAPPDAPSPGVALPAASPTYPPGTAGQIGRVGSCSGSRLFRPHTWPHRHRARTGTHRCLWERSRAQGQRGDGLGSGAQAGRAAPASRALGGPHGASQLGLRTPHYHRLPLGANGQPNLGLPPAGCPPANAGRT